MAIFERTIYSFNGRLTLNDRQDPNKFVLVSDLANIESTTNTIEVDRPISEGSIDFGSKLSSGEFVIPILLYAKTFGDMNELIDNLKEAFNPQDTDADPGWGKGILNFPGGDGFQPMSWAEEISTGTRDVEVFVKPLEVPSVALDTTSGRVRNGVIRMRIEDPRKYLQTVSELVGSGDAENTGNFRTPLEITIGASGTTSTSLTIEDETTGESIVVSTALSAGQTLVIDTRHRSVKLNDVETRSMISTSSDWMYLDAGVNDIVVSNATNATVTLRWQSAWVL